MRICLVAQEYPPVTALGGIGSQTWNKAHALSRLGHDVEVLSSGLAGWPSFSSSVEDGVLVHRIAPPGEGKDEHVPINAPELYSMAYSWGVAQALERLDASGFDVIDFAEYSSEGYAYQLNRTPWHGTAVVVQLHGPLAMFVERIGWPEPHSSFARVGSFMERESIARADALMSCSANIADFTSSHYGVERSRIDVVHCGVDIDAFHPRGDQWEDGHRPTVLFVGNLTASKGLVTTVDAVLRLREKFPGVLLKVVGRGELRDELERHCARAGAAANVEFPDFIGDRSLVPELYREADVFCSPAHHEVGVANVYIEAMASGCPVVAADTGAAPEAVRSGETGLLVRPADIAGTAAALDLILSQPDERKRMGEAGRRRAVEYFALDRYIERVLSCYERAIDAHRGTIESGLEARS